eukprot:COSAG06_NODE_27135_length_600_cov_0.682635_1_plen_126_part_10
MARSHVQLPSGLTQVPWPLHRLASAKHMSLKHSPVSTSHTSGDASVTADGPSTTTDPACSREQVGSVPSHGNGSLLPSAPTSCDSHTVKLPPSDTDTAVMSSPTLLRKTTLVTVADPPDSTVSGTV